MGPLVMGEGGEKGSKRNSQRDFRELSFAAPGSHS